MPANVRPFSTTSQVYPSYLPTLHKSGRLEKRIATATVAAVGIGYGLSRYRQSQAESSPLDRAAYYSSLTTQSAAAATAAVAVEAATETRRQAEAMMEHAYGDRSSLAELEAAVRAYESQQQRKR